MGGPVIVDREDVRVMFRRTTDDQRAITSTWADVEAVVGSLKGRKFYGAFNLTTGEYWVCVELQEGDDPAALGLEEGTLPGGRYARERLEGDPPALYGQIRPAFDRLAGQRSAEDVSRPSLEFYRRHNMVDLFLPIA